MQKRIPKINSAHGSDTRNIINRTIDSVNAQGKSIQDLVAKGQLTPTQYATLLKAINGLVSSGEISIEDIDKNNFKMDGSFFTTEFKKELANGVINTTVLLPESVTNLEVASKAVSPNKTTFLKRKDNPKNLFDGEYRSWVLLGGSDGYFIQQEYPPYRGGLAMVKIKPNTTYTIKVHDKSLSNVFRVGASVDYPKFIDGKFNLNFSNSPASKEYTFSNVVNEYLFVYVSNNGANPRLQIEENTVATDYESGYELNPDLIDYLVEESEELSTVTEHPQNGYDKRPNAKTVIYYGVSEPIDAEPYDEWRELPGFSYFRDFKDGLLGNFKQFGTGFESIRVEKNLGRNVLLLDNTNLSVNGLIWQDVKDKYTDSQEVFIETMSTAPSRRAVSAIHHSTEDGSQFYVSGILPNSTLSIGKKLTESSTVNVLSQTAVNVDVTKPYKLRSSFEDGMVKVKAWQSDVAEPKGWTVEYYDSDPLATTKNLGIMTYGSKHYLYGIGVSTGGMAAPTRNRVI